MSSRPVYHPWTKSEGVAESYSRTLTTPEKILALLNEYAQGQSCPYLGVTVSIDHASSSSFSVGDLKSRLDQAFIATRWTYPTVAAQVKDCKKVVYNVHDADGMAAWAKRTVQYAELAGGWPAKHENISRETPLPTRDGDCALLYLVLSPQQAIQSQITQFDLLLHFHHTLSDGAGLRSIMNTILTNLANPVPQSRFSWGEEARRLEPAALDAAAISDESAKLLAQMPKDTTLPPLSKTAEARAGTGIVKHTFSNSGSGKSSFLEDVKSVSRSKNTKLAATIQAALLTVFYEHIKPTDEEFATVISGFDLRRRDLVEPWGGRNKFVSYAVSLLEIMRTPASLLAGASDKNEGFWTLAKQIQDEWSGVAERKDVAAAGELRKPATGFILGKALAGLNMPPSKMDLSLNYVSDPPGSDQFDGIYQNKERKFRIDYWQLVADESTPKLSCRSHSWNNELTLSMSFSLKHHSREAVEGILKEWAYLLDSLASGVVSRSHL